MTIATFHGIWTAVLLALFVGIVAWVWSGKRKHRYEEAARIPLTDDDETAAAKDRKRDACDG